jgi:hypothetical protein
MEFPRIEENRRELNRQDAKIAKDEERKCKRVRNGRE